MAADLIRLASSFVLFCLVFGMSATVDTHSLKLQFKNTTAITVGLTMQFIVLPFIGFSTIKMLQLDHATGIVLLVIVSSPGGSYSNWWCSLFNADLALSVTMTAISTIMSVGLLPCNLLLYSRFSYGDDLTQALDWKSLALALLLVIAAVCLGLYASALQNSQAFNLAANRMGNYAGIILVMFSAVLSSSRKDARLWERDARFYFGVAFPCTIALLISTAITLGLKLPKTEVVTIAVESCYQNVGIAMSVAIAMFDGDDLARAVGVPFYYGLVQAIWTFLYCFAAWKLGWTKAPKDVKFWKMVSTSYEILRVEQDGEEPHKETDGFYYVEHDDAPKIETSPKQSKETQLVQTV